MKEIESGLSIIFTFGFFVLGLLNIALVVARLYEMYEHLDSYISYRKIWNKNKLDEFYYNLRVNLLKLIFINIPLFIAFAYAIGKVTLYGK